MTELRSVPYCPKCDRKLQNVFMGFMCAHCRVILDVWQVRWGQ